jgi:hypothetical protein
MNGEPPVIKIAVVAQGDKGIETFRPVIISPPPAGGLGRIELKLPQLENQSVGRGYQRQW